MLLVSARMIIRCIGPILISWLLIRLLPILTCVWLDQCMKWQQYPSASMSAKGKSSGHISMSYFMPFLPIDFLSPNAQKPENVLNEDSWASGLEVFLCPPQLDRGLLWCCVTLTFDLRPWKVNQFRVWSLPMRVPNLRTINPMVFELSRKHHYGGWLWHKAIYLLILQMI